MFRPASNAELPAISNPDPIWTVALKHRKNTTKIWVGIRCAKQETALSENSPKKEPVLPAIAGITPPYLRSVYSELIPYADKCSMHQTMLGKMKHLALDGYIPAAGIKVKIGNCITG